MDCSPPGSSVHGILQAIILEWVAILFSSGSSQLRDQTQVSCTAGRFFTIGATRESQIVKSPRQRENLESSKIKWLITYRKHCVQFIAHFSVETGSQKAVGWHIYHFFFFFAIPGGMWDLNSQARNWTCSLQCQGEIFNGLKEKNFTNNSMSSKTIL